MARVVFSSAQAALTDGDRSVELAARRVIDLLERIYERYPRLAGQLDECAVAIDGDIHNDARFQSLGPTSEVHFLGAVAGGR